MGSENSFAQDAWTKAQHGTIEYKITAAATDLAKQWDGWGTALKPAHEPIVVARKPFAGTVINNIVQHGTGAINIDACRIEFSGEADLKSATFGTRNDIRGGNFNNGTKPTGEVNVEANPKGRWPANLIHDGSEEVLEAFAQFGNKQSGKPSGIKAGGQAYAFGEYAGGIPVTGYGDAGSVARFFYCAKADATDRHEGILKRKPTQFAHGNTLQKVERTEKVGNDHETVKPVALMQYLCRLVTPPGGVVLDNFMGSGSTGKAAVKEGFSFVGIELREKPFQDAEARITHAARKYGQQQTL